jgi:hypothetical protein
MLIAASMNAAVWRHAACILAAETHGISSLKRVRITSLQ